jgi:hypothetical protein
MTVRSRDLDDTPAGRLRKLDQAVARLRYADHRNPEAFHEGKSEIRGDTALGRGVGPAPGARRERAAAGGCSGDNLRTTSASAQLQALPSPPCGAVAPAPVVAARRHAVRLGGNAAALMYPVAILLVASNAMTSRPLLDFVEVKLAEHGVEKLMPEDAILEQHARRLIEQQLAKKAIARLSSEDRQLI